MRRDRVLTVRIQTAKVRLITENYNTYSEYRGIGRVRLVPQAAGKQKVRFRAGSGRTRQAHAFSTTRIQSWKMGGAAGFQFPVSSRSTLAIGYSRPFAGLKKNAL